MYVQDITLSKNDVVIDDVERVLSNNRIGEYGAYIFFEKEDGPSLWIHINNDKFYLYYFKDNTGRHPGFHSMGNRIDLKDDMVKFVQVGAVMADGFDAPGYSIVGVADAIRAAREFLETKSLPQSVEWQEL
jgi:hypothetical protein